jgi:transposase
MAGGRLVAQDGDIAEVEAPEEIVAQVAAIDVAKASGMVCTRVPHPAKPGQRATKVWQVPATTNAIIELAEQLACQGIQRVVVESTSDYWRPFVYLLEARGLVVWLVNARDVKHLPGRPKTDRLDAVWLAKLNERGMLRPSFVPPAEIRQLRDYTRLRSDLTGDRARHVQRLEKLLEDALIKLGTVATDIMGVSGRAMLEALIAGQRDPKVLAELARGRMRGKRAALVAALTGRFDAHHAELARMLLDHIDSLGIQIDRLTSRIQELIGAIPAAQPPGGGAEPSGAGTTAATTGTQDTDKPLTPTSNPTPLSALQRLDEVPGIGGKAAQVLIAELGLDMGQFPTPGHLVSWARLSPRTIQSGAKRRAGTTGKGNPYLKGVLGEVAAAAAKTDTFLGERYRRLVKRIGKLKALVAVARSILVIVWHLLADPTARFHDLGADYHSRRIDKDRKTRTHIRQLQALGYTVTLTAAA